MSMLTTFTTIKLSLARTSPTYTAARSRHLALGPYETPAAVHHALRHDKSLTIHQHDAIVSALVQAMLVTHGTDESLKDYVAREYAHLTEKERASAYARLKVARQDVLTKLHAQLAWSNARVA